jgi:hypothetical protein
MTDKLGRYRSKRDFEATAEPRGGENDEEFYCPALDGRAFSCERAHSPGTAGRTAVPLY